MANPTDIATDAVLGNQDFFRFTQRLASPGDIFELEQPCLAAILGPDCDISQVTLSYFSKRSPLEIADASITPGAPFCGRIDASTDKVGSTGQRARILISTQDMVNANYVRPTPGVAPPSRRSQVPAVMDVLFYSKQPPFLPVRRPDKIHRFPAVPFEYISEGNPDGSTDICIPIFGRRMISISAVSVLPYRLVFYAGSWLASGNPAPLELGYIEQITSSTAALTKTAVYRASDQWDSRLSTPSNETTVNQPLGTSKGIADFLVINVRASVPVPGTSLLDQLTVRLSDEET